HPLTRRYESIKEPLLKIVYLPIYKALCQLLHIACFSLGGHMKEEGFLNRALRVVKDDDMSARFLANQAHFNGSDDQEIHRDAKVSVIFALNVLNEDRMANQLEEHIDRAHNATTQGEVRQIISDVYAIMPKNLDPV
ncbi:hypothetical protein OC507_22640, partial [Vibrio vulnificus]|nr:hypothetical protein [Vibrio vulnificus]